MFMCVRVFILLSILIWCNGCSSTKEQNTQTQNQQEDISDVRIILQRTPCFGTCPVYTVTVSGTGDVQFIGTQYVNKEGELRKQIPVDSVRVLVNLFRKAEFFTMKDVYENRAMSDAPTAIITYATKDRKKTVNHYLGDMTAPEVLRTLESRIDGIAAIREWIETQQD